MKTLPAALLDLISAAMPGWSSERVAAMYQRLGLETGRPSSLREVGSKLGLTRERVRQLETSLRGALRSSVADAEFLELNRAVAVLGRHPQLVRDLGQIPNCGDMTVRAIVLAAQSVGRALPVALVEIDGVEALVPAGWVDAIDADHLGALTLAGRMSDRAGAAGITELVVEMVGAGISLSREQAHFVVMASDRFRCEGDWFWRRTPSSQNTLVSVSRQMLSVHSPLRLRQLREGLRRRLAFRQRHTVPPRAILRRVYETSNRFGIDGDDYVRALESLDPTAELGDVQLSMIRILREAPNCLLDRETFMARCRAAGLKLSSVGVYMTYGTCIYHVAPNVWSVVGNDVSPAVVDAFVSSQGGRNRELETGWDEHGRPWMALKVSASFLGTPSIALPRDLRPILSHLEFDVVAPDGSRCCRVLADSTGAFIYGWQRFLHQADVDIGDWVKTTFELVPQIALVNSGGAEVVNFTPSLGGPSQGGTTTS